MKEGQIFIPSSYLNFNETYCLPTNKGPQHEASHIYRSVHPTETIGGIDINYIEIIKYFIRTLLKQNYPKEENEVL